MHSRIIRTISLGVILAVVGVVLCLDAHAQKSTDRADAKRKDNETVQKADRQLNKENRKADVRNNFGESLKARPGEQGRTVVQDAVKRLGPQGKAQEDASTRSDARRTGQIIIEQGKQQPKK